MCRASPSGWVSPKRRSDFGAARLARDIDVPRNAGASIQVGAGLRVGYVGQHGAPSEAAPRRRTSSGVAAPAPVLQVSVRGRLVAPARLFRFLGRGITGARRLLAFALFPIVASAELCRLLVGQGVLLPESAVTLRDEQQRWKARAARPRERCLEAQGAVAAVAHHALWIGAILAHIDFLDEQIDRLSDAIEEQIRPLRPGG
jgi:hypothetical protein